MTEVTVLPKIDILPKSGAPLVRVMNERLIKLAAELQVALIREFDDERYCEDLIIYISYNSKYHIRWKIMNDVPGYIRQEVENHCGRAGYIPWRELDLYSMIVKK